MEEQKNDFENQDNLPEEQKNNDLVESALNQLEERRNKILSGSLNCVPSPFKKFATDFPGLEQSQYICVTSFTKGGKCFGKGTKVRMADNSIKKVEDIKPHDFVMSPGTEAPKEVLQVGHGTEKMYRITSQMYDPLTVNASHIMYLYDCYSKKYITITMKELFQIYNNMNWEYFCRKYKMVASEAVSIEGAKQDLPVEPYFYGIWLGDGSTKDTEITTPEKEIVAYLEEYAARLGFHVSSYPGEDKCPRYRICRNSHAESGLRPLFGSVCNWNKQHINPDYLNSTIENRYQLLAGILDTDGYLNPNKSGYEICLQYESLIDDIIDLSRSLGLTCHKFSKYNKQYQKFYYCATISGDKCDQIPVRVKKVTHASRVNRRHYVFKIEEVGEGEYYGFTIEGNHLFLLSDYTIVHNTQIVSYMFIFELVWFAYFTKADIDFHIIYFALEETKERIMQRFMSWLLFRVSKKSIRINPTNLRSTSKAVDEDILDKLREFNMLGILNYFAEHIEFPTEENPTGIYKYCRQYAEDHGTVKKKTIKMKDELGQLQDVEVFDSYEQDNPNEYRIVVIDTINLISEERGWKKKECMDKMSEYCAKDLRNKYHFSPIVIQQQAFESEGNDAFKLGRVRPSVYGLGDSKYISRDADLVLGLFSPARFGITEYFGYDITKFKDHIRFLEVIVNRNGQMGGLLPLWFDGDVCDFKELPKSSAYPDATPADKANLDKIYALCRTLDATGKYPPSSSTPSKATLLFLPLANGVKHIINLNKF